MKALLLTIALCASAAMAQQSTGTVKGQVLDELGGALVGASETTAASMRRFGSA